MRPFVKYSCDSGILLHFPCVFFRLVKRQFDNEHYQAGKVETF